MRGSMRKNLWSSIAREDIYKVARALVRARRQAQETARLPTYPKPKTRRLGILEIVIRKSSQAL